MPPCTDSVRMGGRPGRGNELYPLQGSYFPDRNKDQITPVWWVTMSVIQDWNVFVLWLASRVNKVVVPSNQNMFD